MLNLSISNCYPPGCSYSGFPHCGWHNGYAYWATLHSRGSLLHLAAYCGLKQPVVYEVAKGHGLSSGSSHANLLFTALHSPNFGSIQPLLELGLSFSDLMTVSQRCNFDNDGCFIDLETTTLQVPVWMAALRRLISESAMETSKILDMLLQAPIRDNCFLIFQGTPISEISEGYQTFRPENDPRNSAFVATLGEFLRRLQEFSTRGESHPGQWEVQFTDSGDQIGFLEILMNCMGNSTVPPSFAHPLILQGSIEMVYSLQLTCYGSIRLRPDFDSRIW